MKSLTYYKGGLLIIAVALIFSLISVSDTFGMWLTVGLLLAGGITLLLSLILQLKNAIIKPFHRLYAKDFYLKFMATLMGFFLIVGTLLYMYVFYTIGNDPAVIEEIGHKVQFSNIEYFLRSLICSLDLFMLDVDSNILDRLDGHSALKGWLAVQAVLSFACTVTMLIGLVYSRLNAYYKLNYATNIKDSNNHLYIFFGNNEPTELLIKDIIKSDGKAIAIIIDEANVNEDGNDEWEGIVGLISHKPKIFKTVRKIGAHVALASQQLDQIDEEIATREDFDAFGYLGLSKIRKLIQKLSQTDNPQLHIFFMGEDEELNIRNIIALAKDKTISSLAKNKALFHRIYCHARYNGPNRVIQDVALKKHLNIKIVDSSHIAIELLKLDPKCHPVNVVKINDDALATVDSTLKTLIVGFGEVGRDAFRFLYEFGAFVDSHDTNIRSPFECVIVDNNIKDIAGTFMASMPGIFRAENWGKMGNSSIRFENINFNSKQFYDKVLYKYRFLEDVNYIVISIGNNDEAIALASRIFNQVRRVRDDLSNLRIYVRCTDNNKVEGIQKIADHYNYGYGEGEKNVPVIHIFGQPEKTYTYDLVVSDHLIEMGKLFHKKYCALSGEGSSWSERHSKLTQTGIPNIEKLRKLRRQESQDRANALHAGTKMIFLKEAMNYLANVNNTTVDWYLFLLKYFKADGSANVIYSEKEIHYPQLTDKENEIILHLAMLEHLRWNAAHELMGYVYNQDKPECDERMMKHNCLCAWTQLDSESTKSGYAYKKYDFCVVDTTISLNKDNLLYPKSNG